MRKEKGSFGKFGLAFFFFLILFIAKDFNKFIPCKPFKLQLYLHDPTMNECWLMLSFMNYFYSFYYLLFMFIFCFCKWRLSRECYCFMLFLFSTIKFIPTKKKKISTINVIFSPFISLWSKERFNLKAFSFLLVYVVMIIVLFFEI